MPRTHYGISKRSRTHSYRGIDKGLRALGARLYWEYLSDKGYLEKNHGRVRVTCVGIMGFDGLHMLERQGYWKFQEAIRKLYKEGRYTTHAQIEKMIEEASSQ